MFRLFQYYFKLIIKTICDPSCSPSCSRRMATRRSMWARCSTTERTPLVQVKEILKFYQWWNFPIFRGRWWHFLDWEVPRKVMTHYFWLNLQECVSSFFCEIKDIHRPADIYGGNGASWEAVPSIEKPLVRVREEDDIKPIHELFFSLQSFYFPVYIYLI